MSNSVFLLKKGIEEKDIPTTTIHLIISHDYNDILYNLPEKVNELTIMTNNKIFYNNIPNGITIINISLINLREYNIILDNLPVTLEKIRLSDYSKYTEFEFLDKILHPGIYSIEVRRRTNLSFILKNNIKKIPFGCKITNQFDEELIELLPNYEC